MTFMYPWVLLLWLPCVGLLLHVWVTEGRPAKVPFDHGDVRHCRFAHFVLRCAGMVPAALLAIAVAILARPQVPGVPKDEKVMQNILFCLDASGSMSGQKFNDAIKAIEKFTEYRDGDSFGLVVFGNECWQWVPVTRDTSAIAHSAPFLNPRNLPPWFGGTQIAKALRSCRDILRKTEDGDKRIILVTDGVSGDIIGGSGVQCAFEMKEANIVVHGIHIDDHFHFPALGSVCSITGGKMYETLGKGGLDEIFRDIDRMEKAKFQARAPEKEDFYFYFAVAGLTLLGIYVCTLFGLRYTPW